MIKYHNVYSLIRQINAKDSRCEAPKYVYHEISNKCANIINLKIINFMEKNVWKRKCKKLKSIIF